jgi:enoyl-CoA hydratase
MDTYTDVLFEEISGNQGNLGVITLNRPEVLNSLNHTMVHAMHARLKIWATANPIKAVVIRAANGRAFCAGGDLRLTYKRYLEHDPALPHFFRDEYQLNQFIFHFPKPYIALLDGMTLGGGVGISIHGSHRVATDSLLFAMPETGIGFYPDVGGSYFLPRLPNKMGFYLGLTGEKIASDDCVAIGIAQQKVARESLPELMNALAQEAFGNDARASVTQIIKRFNMQVKPSRFFGSPIATAIDTCFSATTMEEIVQSLQYASDPIGKETANILAKKSPASLKITLRALQEGKRMDFDACMRQEYRLSCHFLQGHDFFEGIRAVIIDKDQAPHWNPSTLEGVTQSEVEKYFTPLTEELV